MKVKVYIVVRKAEDIDMNSVDIFNGVFATKKEATNAAKQYKEDFGDKYEVITRELK